MRSRLLPAVAVGGTVALILTGCFGGDPDENDAPPPVAVDTISVPDALLPTSASADIGYGMVGGSDSLPWIVGGSLAEPGEAAAPTVWTSTDSSGWTATRVGDTTGSFSGSVAGSDTLAALGGTLWNDGEYTSALWTSGDGEKWTSVKLPEEFLGNFRLGDIGVSGDVLFGVGTNSGGAARGILVNGDKVSLVDLPKQGKKEFLSAQSVVVSGKTVVLIATPGPEGEPSPTVSFTSDDLGKTWGKAVTITDSVGFVSGATAVDDGFVATGGAPRGDGANGLAAWFSADGASWATESVPAPPEDGPLFTLENSDTWLGTPLVRGGVVGAVLGNDNSAFSGVYTRQPGGAWAMVAQTTANSTNGATGVAMSAGGGSVVGAIIGSNYARMGVVAGGWSDTTVLSAREDIASVLKVYPGEKGASVTLTRSTFTVEPDNGWRNENFTTLGQLEGDTLSEAAWDPEAAGSWSGTRLVSDEDGAQLVLGAYFDFANSVIPVQGFFRASDDADWTPVSGFEAAGAASLNGAEKIGDTWIAWGTTRDSSAAADPEHGAVWTSADGVSWTRAAGDFGSGTLESELSDICALPGGDLIGVGWTEISEGEFRTTVWGGASGQWSAVDVGDLDSGYGFATSCASDEDGVILGASVSGRDTLQRSTDGSTWKEVFRADRGISIGEPVAVEGGFAASGTVTGKDFSGPVVWLSKSGTEWTPVSIPSHDSGSTTSVSPVGDDLLVAMSGRIGDPVTVIRDIATVIAEKG